MPDAHARPCEKQCLTLCFRFFHLMTRLAPRCWAGAPYYSWCTTAASGCRHPSLGPLPPVMLRGPSLNLTRNIECKTQGLYPRKANPLPVSVAYISSNSRIQGEDHVQLFGRVGRNHGHQRCHSPLVTSSRFAREAPDHTCGSTAFYG